MLLNNDNCHRKSQPHFFVFVHWSGVWERSIYDTYYRECLKLGIFETKRTVHIMEMPIRKRYLTIIPRARMGSESIAYEAEGRMRY